MNEIRLQQLFKHYQNAFINYNVNEVSSCYHLPCTLNTPDKIVLLLTPDDCLQEFNAIFTQLKAASTGDIIAQKASYQQVSDQLSLVCIDWDFIDSQGAVFADFAAIYHVLDIDGTLKIVNVVSHELGNSLLLKHKLAL